MRRFPRWFLVLALVLLILPAGSPATATVRADPAAPALPAAVADDEIIVLESNGRIRVDDPVVPAGVKQVTYDSGADIGWTNVTTGDFNGDGDAEIVAFQGGRIKIFDPVLQSGSSAIDFDRSLTSGLVFRLLVTGDFDGDGRDEIAVTHTDTGIGIAESLRIYDGGADGNTWSITRQTSYGALWQAMSVGNVNADAYDDLAMVRNPVPQQDTWSPFLIVYNGNNWSEIVKRETNFPWLTVAMGRMSMAYAEDQLSLTRGEVLGVYSSLVLFRVSGASFADLTPGVDYKYYPYFTSQALGDMNGDGDDEVLLLRDPIEARAALLMVNPAGAAIRTFQQAIGYGADAWNQVRMGDLDGDGNDEVVVLRPNRYRKYMNPQIDDSYLDVTGNFRVPSGSGDVSAFAIANVDGAGQTLGPLLVVSPTSLSFDMEYLQTVPAKIVSISNGGTAASIPWQAQVTDGASWLQLDKTSGGTPMTLSVSVNPVGVVPGNYTGKIVISSAGVTGSPQTVNVSLTVRGVKLVVNPTRLTYSVAYGQVATKVLAITSAGGSSAIQWQANVLEGASWLSLGATSGTAPNNINVTVNGTAAGIGTRQGTIRVRALDPQVADSPQYVTVEITVPDPGFVVSPKQVTIWQLIGGAPRPKHISIWRGGPSAGWVATAVPVVGATELIARLSAGEGEVTAQGINLAGVTVPLVSWLTFTPDSGQTGAAPTVMTVSANAAQPGMYRALILIVATDPNMPNRVQTVEITAYLAATVWQTFVPLSVR